MSEDTEFTKLPVEECCSHKLWKARVHGYTEAAKLFGQADDEKAPIFNQYVSLIPKMVNDSNAAAQEKGLEAVLIFVQNASIAGKIVKDVMGSLVAKCFGATKVKVKELSVQITLMYIETEKHEVVQEELMKGMNQKNPKTVSACISAVNLALNEFGPKVIDMKPLIKIFPTLLEDRDKTVRDEAKNMIVEIHRWMGDNLKPKLSTLKPVQLTELEKEFEKNKSTKATPTRYLRSQQVRQAKLNEATDGGGGDDCVGEDAPPDQAEIDPYELVEAISILNKLPADFYKNIEAKKWQDRKAALEALEKILEHPKYEKGDYGDLVRALMKMVCKDSNVIVVGIAVKCIARLALGLKKHFQPYAGFVLPQLLEKFKEKKSNVVHPLREAVDGIFPVVSLEIIQEDVVASLENKNPSVKAETASYLARCFSKSTPTTLNKKLLKVFTACLLKTLNESDPSVRDSSAEALGVAMKVVGEKVIMPFMIDLDNLKLTKIKEFSEKAVVVKVTVKAPPPVKERIEVPKPVVKKVLTGGAKKAAAAAAAPSSAAAPAVPGSLQPSKNIEKDLTDEEVEEKANEVLSENVVNGLSDPAWKTRLESVESILTTIKIIDPKECSAQVLVRTLLKKPGLKDSNIQVLKLKLDVLRYLSENFTISLLVVELVLPDLVDKIGDPKLGRPVSEILTKLCQSVSLDSVSKIVLETAFQQKIPKVQSEAMNWLCECINDCGCVVDVQCLVEQVRKGLNATNAAVRTSAVNLCATVYRQDGEKIMSLLNNEKPAVLSLITNEIEKQGGENKMTKQNDMNTTFELNDDEEVEVKEHVACIDISSKITSELIKELSDKDWKVRNEALNTLAAIIKDSKSIKPNLGELPAVLAQRLNDSNSKLAQTALDICKNLASAMGSSCKIHVKTFLRGFLTSLGDNKQWVRDSAKACVNTWGEKAGYKEFFEGEIIPDALKGGSPALRTELWVMLGEVLPTVSEKSVSKDELMLCLPYLYTNLEDRNSDVRKAASGAVLGIMIHLGYQTMLKQTEKLKPGSKNVITAILEKVRPDLPVKTEVKQNKPKKEDVVKSVTKASKVVAVKPIVRKKEEDVDLTPLLPINGMKQQRIVDEQRLRTLKWNFTLPRAEFVDLLKEQMTNAKLNRILVSNMFHPDFKYHLKAIDCLNEDLANTEAIISNLDLILKWMTLRFFDTNPSVLLKGLDYLQNVFLTLIETEYVMCESEANAFIPYLVLKIGDPKDAVRDRVRGILKQIAVMYSPSKLFILVMEGLKSKNARQRTECLEEVGSLIEKFGMCVCQPSPSVALKEIAKQISDRDNSVRNAALNAIVKAWYLEGEKVLKLIGNISEKDSSLLGERIRRAGKNRPSTSTSPKQDVNKTKVVEEAEEEDDEEGEVMVESEEPTLPHNTTTPRELNQTFKTTERVYHKMNLIEIDDSFLNSPVRMPEYFSATLQRRKDTFDESLMTILNDVRSSDVHVAFSSSNNLREKLESCNVNIGENINPVVESIAIQLKLLNSYFVDVYGNVLPQTYKSLLKIIEMIFGSKKTVSTLVNVDNLQHLLEELIVTLVDESHLKFGEPGASKIIQVYVSRIIENSNFTNVTCAVIKMLHSTVASPPADPKYTDMVTKCMLKIIVTIKKNSSTIESTLDIDEVLYNCHLFFQAFPQHTWKDRPSVLPLKAIKTLLLTFVQIEGRDVFSHLTLIENPCFSEVAIYLKKLIKSQPDLNVSKTRLTKTMSEHLSDVFMKIAHEATAEEGLMQYYLFKKENPNVDMTPYLSPTSKYFQEYVENGLREIERKMLAGENEATTITALPSTPASSSNDNNVEYNSNLDNSNLAQYYLDKLNSYYQRLGLPPSECPDFVPK